MHFLQGNVLVAWFGRVWAPLGHVAITHWRWLVEMSLINRWIRLMKHPNSTMATAPNAVGLRLPTPSWMPSPPAPPIPLWPDQRPENCRRMRTKIGTNPNTSSLNLLSLHLQRRRLQHLPLFPSRISPPTERINRACSDVFTGNTTVPSDRNS